MAMIDHLEEIYSSNLRFYSKTTDESLKNKKSVHCVSMESTSLRLLAAAEIRLFNNIKSFKARIDRAVRLKMSLIKAYDDGCPVSPSEVTMSCFHWGLDACAAGNIELAKSYFALIGGRKKEERANNSKWILSISYAVKELFLSGKCSGIRLSELKNNFSQPSYVGYALLIEGIAGRNVGQSRDGICEILKKHKMRTRPGGYFWSKPDEIVSFWALGLLNFAAFEGMKLDIPESDLLPRSLIVAP